MTRQRKPRKDLAGYENDHSVVLRSERACFWIIKCKHCEGEHEQNAREIRLNRHTRKCEKFKPHNYSGIERWDGIIRRFYGITLEEYNEMLESQNGVCAICGNKDEVEGRALAIDHCHESKKVRGILCGSCNRGLGLFKDNPELLLKAAEYLSTPQQDKEILCLLKTENASTSTHPSLTLILA